MPRRCVHAAGVQAWSQSTMSLHPRGRRAPRCWPEELDTRVPLCWLALHCPSFDSNDAYPQLSATLASLSADSRDYRAASAPLLCRRFPLQNPWDEGEEEAFGWHAKTAYGKLSGCRSSEMSIPAHLVLAQRLANWLGNPDGQEL